jgi:hypothetical protein
VAPEKKGESQAAEAAGLARVKKICSTNSPFASSNEEAGITRSPERRSVNKQEDFRTYELNREIRRTDN